MTTTSKHARMSDRAFAHTLRTYVAENPGQQAASVYTDVAQKCGMGEVEVCARANHLVEDDLLFLAGDGRLFSDATDLPTDAPLVPALTERTVVQHGIMLPYRYFVRRAHEADVLDEGTVFVSMDTLEALAEQEIYDSHFGSPFIDLTPQQGAALTQAGYAVRETRGGHYGTKRLRKHLNLLWERLDEGSRQP